MSKTHPDWALAHRRPGTELRKIKGHYYLYAVSSKWDKINKRSKKITGNIIGKITPEGELIPSKRRTKNPSKIKKRLEEIAGTISVKEYGVYYLITHHMKDLVEKLKKHFPNEWKYIISVAYCRLTKQLPINRMPLNFHYSFFSERYSDIRFTEKNISLVLRDIGRDRQGMVEFLRWDIPKGEHVLVDMTDLPSRSTNKPFANVGHNRKSNHKGQINLLYIFGNQSLTPVFYRLVPGNIRDVSAFVLTIKESEISDCMLIADKGFYSKKNTDYLEDNGLRFICPLKRNSRLIKEEYLQELLDKENAKYFIYENKVIWYVKKRHQKKDLYLFLNEETKVEEEKDYLTRIIDRPASYSLEKFQKKKKRFGPLTLLTNTARKSGEKIYSMYKSRNQIEVMFDGLKTVLEADKTYMQNEETLQGWMFANHIALLVHHRLYRLLLDSEKLKKYSVKSVIDHLTLIRKAKVNSQWIDTEVVTSTSEMLQSIGIPVT